MRDIAIIYTTLLREDLAKVTIDSIVRNWDYRWQLFIGDQSPASWKYNEYKDFQYFVLDKNCGLSYARNFLIKKAYEQGFKYILMTADSIAFTQQYDFNKIIEFMESKKEIGKVGFNLTNRIPWEFNLTLIPQTCFKLTVSKEYEQFKDINFHKVDICRNFFLGKTEAFINVSYDDDLKLFEHEDHSLRFKELGYLTYYTDSISAKYISDKSFAYQHRRDELMKTSRAKLFNKYNLGSWMSYAPEVTKIFEEWRRKRCS